MGRGGDDFRDIPLRVKPGRRGQELSSSKFEKKIRKMKNNSPLISPRALEEIKDEIWIESLRPNRHNPDKLSIVSSDKLEDIIFTATGGWLRGGQHPVDGYNSLDEKGAVLGTEVKGTLNLNNKTPINIKTIPIPSDFPKPRGSSISSDENRKKALEAARSVFQALKDSIDKPLDNKGFQDDFKEEFGDEAQIDMNVILIAYREEEKDEDGHIVSRKMYLGLEPFNPDPSLADNYQWVLGTKTFGHKGSLYGFYPEDWQAYQENSKGRKDKEQEVKDWKQLKEKRVFEYQSGGNSKGNVRYLPRHPLDRKDELLQLCQLDLPLEPMPQSVYNFYIKKKGTEALLKAYKLKEGEGKEYPEQALNFSERS